MQSADAGAYRHSHADLAHRAQTYRAMLVPNRDDLIRWSMHSQRENRREVL